MNSSDVLAALETGNLDALRAGLDEQRQITVNPPAVMARLHQAMTGQTPTPLVRGVGRAGVLVVDWTMGDGDCDHLTVRFHGPYTETEAAAAAIADVQSLIDETVEAARAMGAVVEDTGVYVPGVVVPDSVPAAIGWFPADPPFSV